MPTLIDLRRRIQSVRNSQQITQAMKTVSTAKFRKAQRTVLEARPFWHLFPELMSRLAYWAAAGAHPLLLRRGREEDRGHRHHVGQGPGRGLQLQPPGGGRRVLWPRRPQTAEVRLVLIGKKAVGYFRKGPYPVDRAFGDRTDRLIAGRAPRPRRRAHAGVHASRRSTPSTSSATSSSPSWRPGS